MSRHKRVAVASPQTRLAMARRSAVRAEPPHLARAELERARRIHRAQLRTALVALGLLGIRVDWLVVGVLPYAALVALAVTQLRRAERIEADRRDGGEPQ